MRRDEEMRRELFARFLSTNLEREEKKSGWGKAWSNIALSKYWGKRDNELHLPTVSSLSISLPGWGSRTKVMLLDPSAHFSCSLNGEELPSTSTFFTRLLHFLHPLSELLSRSFRVETYNTIPTASGLASSASGFAALVRALADLLQWKVTIQDLSLLARLGSGSATRSLYEGFVEWRRGEREDGLDSHAVPLSDRWEKFRIALLLCKDGPKEISSREAMQQTVESSPLYPSWITAAERDFRLLKKAIAKRDFPSVGGIAEYNALAMHATLLAARPSLSYSNSITWQEREKVCKLRKEGHLIFCTQDAGPHLKLLFLEEESALVKAHFPQAILIAPFKT